MPVAVIDPTVHAGGALPASPISGIMQGLIAQQASMYPTPLERSEMQYRQAETQRLTQQNASGTNMGNLVSGLYTPENMGPPPQGPTESGAPMAPPPQPSMDSRLTGKMGDIFKTAFDSGHPELAAGLVRAITANAPGVTFVGSDAQHPSPVTKAMVAAGDAYGSTPDAMLTGPTAGQRDRNAKINDVVNANPGVTHSQAANIVDGVTSVEIDPTTKNAFLVNKADKTSELLRSPAQGINATMPPAGGTSVNNNPFNLRPVGATAGFQNFASPQEGMAAGINDLALKLSGHSKAMGGKPVTLASIISTYSPPNENATAALIQNAAKRMGVDPNAPLDLSHLGALSQAILAQEGNSGGLTGGTTAVAPVSASAAAPTFDIKPGDLGIPFDKIYGGGAALNKGMGIVGALTGSPNANADVTSGLRDLNSIKNQLSAINSQRPGQRNNAAAQASYLRQFPSTDPQVNDLESGMEGATTGSGSAENQFIKNFQEAVSNRIEDTKMLADPNTSAEERQAASIRVNNLDKLMATLSPAVQTAYQKAIGGKVVETPQTNLEKGMAATTVPTGKVRVVDPSGKTGFIDQAELAMAISNGWKRAQ